MKNLEVNLIGFLLTLFVYGYIQNCQQANLERTKIMDCVQGFPNSNGKDLKEIYKFCAEK